MLTKLSQATSILACGLNKHTGHSLLYPEWTLVTAPLPRVKGD